MQLEKEGKPDSVEVISGGPFRVAGARSISLLPNLADHDKGSEK